MLRQCFTSSIILCMMSIISVEGMQSLMHAGMYVYSIKIISIAEYGVREDGRSDS